MHWIPQGGEVLETKTKRKRTARGVLESDLGGRGGGAWLGAALAPCGTLTP